MVRKITFDELIGSVAGKTGQSKTFSRILIKEMAVVIEQGLVRDGFVNISGFGIFKIHEVPSRKGRNIRSGEAITIPAQKKVLFRPEKSLRELINKQYQHLRPQILPDQNVEEKQEPIGAAIFRDVFDGAAAEVDVHEADTPAKTEKKEEIAPLSEVKSPVITKEGKEKKKLSAIPVIISVLAILLVFFLYMQFSSNDESSVAKETITQPQVTVDSSKMVKDAKPIAPVVEKSPPPADEIHTTVSGDNLWNLAYKNYGDGYLWPLIYAQNSSLISNPDLLKPGLDLVIPHVGTDKNSPEVKKRLSQGNLLAYHAYKKMDRSEAINFLYVAHKYDPENVSADLASVDPVDMKKILAYPH